MAVSDSSPETLSDKHTRSRAHAAFIARSRPISIFIASSPSIIWIDSRSARRMPKPVRSAAWARAISTHPFESRGHRMQWVTRAGPSLICVALSPPPSFISTAEVEISNPSRTTVVLLRPHDFDAPLDAPAGWSRSKRSAVRPLHVSLAILAIRMKCWTSSAPVMNHLRPLITYLSPRFSALVRIIEESEPPLGIGSVMAKAERTLPSTTGFSQRSLAPVSERLPTASSCRHQALSN